MSAFPIIRKLFLVCLLVNCINTGGFVMAQSANIESVKVATFCKVWGFLKYYHPVVAKGHINWDREFINRVQVIKKLESKHALNNYYSDWINSLGKIAVCKSCNNNVPDSLKFNLDLAWTCDTALWTEQLIVQWQHIEKNRNQKSNHYVKSYPFVGHVKFTNEIAYKDSLFPTVELRLLGLARFWNAIHYFFPYKYMTDENWNEVLNDMVPLFMYAQDTTAYHMAMLELVARVNDTHAQFVTYYTNRYFGFKWAPFWFKIVDNKAIVVSLGNDSLCRLNDIKVGDAFLSIGGASIEEIINRRSKYICASNKLALFRNSYHAIFNGDTDSVLSTFEREGIVYSKTLYRYYYLNILKKVSESKGTLPAYRVMEGNIGYVNMGSLQKRQVKGMIKALQHTRAIIFDVRSYPNGTMYKIAKFLNDSACPFVKFTAPDLSYPGVYAYTTTLKCGKRNSHSYKGKVILLFNEYTQSHAEFTLMALQTAPRAILIGSQTAGADGNVTDIVFPGNYRIYISGIGVYYPDGRATQRIGIVPDIEVNRTIEGLRSGRDLWMEKALEVINK